LGNSTAYGRCAITTCDPPPSYTHLHINTTALACCLPRTPRLLPAPLPHSHPLRATRIRRHTHHAYRHARTPLTTRAAVYPIALRTRATALLAFLCSVVGAVGANWFGRGADQCHLPCLPVVDNLHHRLNTLPLAHHTPHYRTLSFLFPVAATSLLLPVGSPLRGAHYTPYAHATAHWFPAPTASPTCHYLVDATMPHACLPALPYLPLPALRYAPGQPSAACHGRFNTFHTPPPAVLTAFCWTTVLTYRYLRAYFPATAPPPHPLPSVTTQARLPRQPPPRPHGFSAF